MRLPSILAFLLLAAPAVAQTQVTLTATDSKSINPAGTNWNDNRLRAYWSSGLTFVDGFVKFDLSSIPDGALITGLTLRAYHEANFGSPAYGPTATVYRVDDDSWQRGVSNAHPGLGVALTPALSAFNSGSQAPNDFVLNTAATSWTPDLVDDTLSLALRNEAGVYSYVYFYGSDVSPAPPELIVDYLVGPSLSISAGAPGGTMTFDFSGFTANAQGAVLYGPAGSLTGNAPCGTVTVLLTPINYPPVSQVILVGMDANGNGQLSQNVPGGAVGLRVQAVDLASCDVSNFVTL